MNDLSELFRLSIAERIQLVEDLWDSIAADTGSLPPLSHAQIVDIERRSRTIKQIRSWLAPEPSVVSGSGPGSG